MKPLLILLALIAFILVTLWIVFHETDEDRAAKARIEERQRVLTPAE